MRVRLIAGALCAAAAVAATGASALPAYAADCAGLPKHAATPVVDTANVLPPEPEAYLGADLMLYHLSGHEAIVAATVPDLGGDDVASYAKRLFDCWGIGDKGSDNGVLILVAMRERRARIELGAGLAGRINDEDLDLALEAMTAPLRAGDVAAGLRAAATAVADDLGNTLPDSRSLATAGTGTTAGTGDAADGTDATGQLPDDLPAGFPQGEPHDGFDPYGSSGSGGPPFGAVTLLFPVLIGIGFIVTIVRAISGAGGGSTWRGGPGWGGMTGRGYWGTPTMLRRGTWFDGGSNVGGSSFGDSGSSSMGSSSGDSGGSASSGGSFGGGSSGGGGASGSW